MELNEDIFNAIHQYLNNDLEVEERQNFEIQMNQNPALAQEVATQRRIKSGLKINGYKQQFGNIHAKLKKENTLPFYEGKSAITLKPRKSTLQYFAYAASIILILGVGLFFYLKPEPIELVNTKTKTPKSSIKTIKPDKIEIAEVHKPMNKPVSIDFDKIYANNFVKKPVIESPFSNEKYGVSPSKIAAWDSDTSNFSKGIQYLETKKTQNAIAEFQKLAVSKFEQIRFQSDWYLALSYLQEKDLTSTKKQLATIIENEKHIYANKSKILLKSLK